MRRALILSTVVILFTLSACADDSTSPSGPGSGECVEPPQSELRPDSEFEITVEPNPVEAGGRATLSVEYDQADGSDITGVGVTWECWDGQGWVQTHVIVRAFNQSPATVLDSTGTVAIPDIGLVVPHSHEILIPEVASGMYRLTDLIYTDGAELTGHVIVEVTG